MQGDYQRIADSWFLQPAGEVPDPDRAAADPAGGTQEPLWMRWCGVTRPEFARLLHRRRLRDRLNQGDLHAGPPARPLFEPRRRALPPATAPQWRYGVADTPFGELAVAFNGCGALCRADFLAPERGAAQVLTQWGRQAGAPWTEDHHFAESSLTRWSQGDQESIVLSPAGTDFQLRVWLALLAIPPGAVMSYRQLAASIGQPGAVRAVASAVAANPIAWVIPCHRVIRTDGCSGEYRWGARRKQLMIGWEATQGRVGAAARLNPQRRPRSPSEGAHPSPRQAEPPL